MVDVTSKPLVPVTLVTGFLGSGKTTLLNRLLSEPALDGTVAIINEFGAIGLDHLLVEVTEERFALLDNGCVCCTVRDDLVETLKRLPEQHQAVGRKPIDRVVIETTGLADPAPILHALMVEPELAATYRIDGVVTTVDAVNGLDTLTRHIEARKQAGVADLLLLTKADLASPEAIVALHTALASINGTAVRRVATHGTVRMDDVLGAGSPRHIDHALTPTRDQGHACTDPACTHAGHGHHLTDIMSHAFVIDEPVEWARLRQWLDHFAALRGADMLRMKGLVAIAEHPEAPLVLHGVQHIFHPPQKLDAWPSVDRRTRLVFIVKDIPRETIERTLKKFVGVSPVEIRSAA